MHHGKHNRLNRQVAIKILHEPIRSDPAMMSFFRAEALTPIPWASFTET
jgi:hypothetical protein